MMTNNIPQGYKDSPLGIIPVEWEAKQFIDICKVNQGLQIPISERLKKQEPNSYKYITIQYLNNAKEEEYIKNPNSSVICTFEDVLMTRTGNTGIVISDVEGVFHNNFFKIAYDKKIVNKLFLIEFLNTKKTQHLILVKAGTSTIPDLNHKDFYSIYISLPPLSEQQKIAEILSTWDDAIEKQTQLIDKLETRKRGLMQQLLTGKKRLKGFEGEWKDVKLGDICDINTGGLDANAMNKDGQYSFFTCAKEIFKIDVFAFDTEALLISGNGEHVGYIHYYKGKFNAYQRTYVLDKFKENILFIKYFLDYHLPQRILQTKSSSNTPYIVKSSLSDMQIRLCSKEEETAIANILSTADKEIDLAKKKLADLKEQKKGLMQVLLTGKKRVKILEIF